MFDDMHPARRPARPEGLPARDDAGHRTLSPTGPLRPETGSPLDMLLRRQTLATGARGLLSHVPAQVR